MNVKGEEKKKRKNEIKIFYRNQNRLPIFYIILFQIETITWNNERSRKIPRFEIFHVLFVRYSPTNNFITTDVDSIQISREIFPQLRYIYTYQQPGRIIKGRGRDITGLVLWHPVLNIVNELCYRWTPGHPWPFPSH